MGHLAGTKFGKVLSFQLLAYFNWGNFRISEVGPCSGVQGRWLYCVSSELLQEQNGSYQPSGN